LLAPALLLIVALLGPAAPPSRAQGEPDPSRLGSFPWLTVLCRGADGAYLHADPVATFTGLMGGEAPGFNHYFRELSYGAMNIDGSRVVGVYTLPGPTESYYEYRNDTYYLRDSAVADCLAAADPAVNFPDYAGVHVVLPQLSGWTRVASEVVPGGWLATFDGQERVYALSKLTIPRPGHSLFAHEWLHALGLMHSSGPYFSDYDSSWDAVSGGRNAPPGCNNFYENYFCAAMHTIAYHKARLGWIPAERTLTVLPGTVHRIELHQLATMPAAPGPLLYVKVPYWAPVSGNWTLGAGFFTLEARRQVGYDKTVPGNAVIVHNVDETTGYFHQTATVLDVDNNGNANDAGAMWTPGETLVQSQGGVTMVMCVESESATGFVLTVAANADACGVTFSRIYLPLLAR
jgi:hypothetical protein